MKKIIAIMAVIGAFAATAADSYLYWLVDTEEANTFVASLDKSYNKVVLKSQGADNPLATVSAAQAAERWDYELPYNTSVGDYYTAGANFIVELYNGDDWVAQSAILAYKGGATANIGTVMNPPSGGAYTFSGFNVPEPTSGLLMLVGGMLLALRRRRMA